MPNDEAFDYLPTQAVADFLASGNLDGILFPSAQSAEVGLNVVLFQKASFVEELSLPPETKVEASLGHFDDEGWEPDYYVSEEVPPPKRSKKKPKANPFELVLDVAKLHAILEKDPRPPSLRVDTNEIRVHHVSQVQVISDDHLVRRHRWKRDRRRTPY
jgi:hypothetical protein